MFDPIYVHDHPLKLKASTAPGSSILATVLSPGRLGAGQRRADNLGHGCGVEVDGATTEDGLLWRRRRRPAFGGEGAPPCTPGRLLVPLLHMQKLKRSEG
jgi:hypothetical protein